MVSGFKSRAWDHTEATLDAILEILNIFISYD